MSHSISLKITRSTHRALIVALTLSCATLAAQSNPPPVESTAQPAGVNRGTTATPITTPSPSSGSVGAIVEHDFSSDLTDGLSGNVDVTNYEVYGAYTHHFTDADRLTLGADYLYRDYNFHGTPAPFGDVEQAGVNAWYEHDINQQWGAFGYLYGGFAAEKAASFSKGGQVAAGLGPTVNVTKELRLAFGPMVYSRPGDDVTVGLVGNMDWAFQPRWNLHLYAGAADGSSTTYNALVTYDLLDDHTTTLETSLAANDFWFRVQDAPSGTDRGVVETDVTLKVGVRKELGNNIFVRGYVSGIFDHKYQFHSGDRATSSFRQDPTMGIGIELGISF